MLQSMGLQRVRHNRTVKNNACPLPPNDNGKGEQRAEKRESGEEAGLEREEKSPQSVIGPDLRLCGLLSSGRKGQGTEFIKVRSSESACNAGDPGSLPGSGRSPGEGIGYPFQYSWASLVLSWLRIHPQCRRPGFDPWVGKISWRREQQPTPVFCPGEFHGLYSPWGCKEPEPTELKESQRFRVVRR